MKRRNADILSDTKRGIRILFEVEQRRARTIRHMSCNRAAN